MGRKSRGKRERRRADEPIGGRCPACGVQSTLIMGPTQAFCTNPDDCRVIAWNPSKTMDQALDEGVETVSVSGEEPR